MSNITSWMGVSPFGAGLFASVLARGSVSNGRVTEAASSDAECSMAGDVESTVADANWPAAGGAEDCDGPTGGLLQTTAY
jgi:hypothetical protein